GSRGQGRGRGGTSRQGQREKGAFARGNHSRPRSERSLYCGFAVKQGSRSNWAYPWAGRMRALHLVPMFGVSLLLAFCGGEGDDNQSCEPGTSSACTCPSGAKGTRTCYSNGTGYGACTCGNNPDASSDGSDAKGGGGTGGGTGGATGGSAGMVATGG